MKAKWNLIWANLREFSAGRTFENDYRWLKNEISMSREDRE